MGCLGYSEQEVGRRSRDATSHVKKKERRKKDWAKCCKKDLRQEMSEILGSHLAVPEPQNKQLRQL